MSHKIIKYFAIWLVAALSLVFTACGGNHEEPRPTTAPRTVLVYQVANNNLSGYAADDIREMLNGSQKPGAITNHTIQLTMKEITNYTNNTEN